MVDRPPGAIPVGPEQRPAGAIPVSPGFNPARRSALSPEEWFRETRGRASAAEDQVLQTRWREDPEGMQEWEAAQRESFGLGEPPPLSGQPTVAPIKMALQTILQGASLGTLDDNASDRVGERSAQPASWSPNLPRDRPNNGNDARTRWHCYTCASGRNCCHRTPIGYRSIGSGRGDWRR